MEREIVVDFGSGRLLLTPDRDWRVGRDADCEIRLHDERISRHHGVIRCEAENWVYTDLGSSNGSFVRGSPVSRLALVHNLEFRLGSPTSGVVIRAIAPSTAHPPSASRVAFGAAALLAAGVIAAAAFAGPAPDVQPSPVEASTAVAPSPSLSRTQIVDLGRAATVRVQRGNSRGSGVSLPGDLVLTAAHVLDQQGRIGIYLEERLIGYAEFVRQDDRHDLALLRLAGLESAGARPVGWGVSSELRQGEEVVALGFPVDLPLSVKVGVVSGLRRDGGTELIQTDASLNPGMSGGPMLNAKGELVGITVFGYSRYAGLNFAVASVTARRFVESAR